MTNCFLHIGTGKTGTTSIQRFMASNRDILRAQGYLFPSTPGDSRQVIFSAYGRNAKQWSASRIRATSRVIDYADFEHRFAEELKQDPTPNVVLSDESLFELTPKQIKRLLGFLGRFFSKVYVIIYLRAQEGHILSRYQQTIKSGDTRTLAEFINTAGYSNVENYFATLEKWSDAVGRDALRPRIFDRREFVKGSLVVDFLSTIGMTNLDWVVDPPLLNETLDAESVEFFRLCNEHCFSQIVHERSHLLRRWLTNILVRGSSGTKVTLPQGTREKLMPLWADSNAMAARKYFGKPDGVLFQQSVPAAKGSAPPIKGVVPAAKDSAPAGKDSLPASKISASAVGTPLPTAKQSTALPRNNAASTLVKGPAAKSADSSDRPQGNAGRRKRDRGRGGPSSPLGL